MSTKSHLRTKYWLYVFGLVGCIYSTLYVARPVCTFLKATIPLFSVFINVIIISALAVVIFLFWKHAGFPRPSTCIILCGVISSYVYGLTILKHPEERIHFLEYGLLAYLVFKALSVDVQKLSAYGWAFIITSLFGWMDEGIQFLLPNRYYQTEDVILNAVSGDLGLVLVFVYSRERRNKN